MALEKPIHGTEPEPEVLQSTRAAYKTEDGYLVDKNEESGSKELAAFMNAFSKNLVGCFGY